MKVPTSEEIKAMYKTGSYSVQEDKCILKQKYANKALFEAIWSLDLGETDKAMRDIIEVLSYLVNK